MIRPRRAEPEAPSRAALRIALTGAAVGLAAVSAASAALSVNVARRIVRPGGRVPDTRILAVDTAAQTVTLARTPDTALPGRYGMFTTGTTGYVKLGSVLASDSDSVTRKLLTQIERGADLSAAAAFSGWYYDEPDQLHIAYDEVFVETQAGPCPAWLFPGGDTWVIQVHGRGTTRAEGLRAVPVLHASGATTMLVSYRNDGDAPRTSAGSYALGMTEWRDVDAAVGYALAHGAARVVVMGWSMGGAIALQLALNGTHRDAIVGLILESPVVDWRTVLGFQARQLRLPAPVAAMAMGALGQRWAGRLTGSDTTIRFDSLDLVRRADELQHPMLILHSDDDGFVPSSASHRLHAARPDLVTFETFRTARHTKLWNFDQERWEGAIARWLDAHGRAGAEQATPTT